MTQRRARAGDSLLGAARCRAEERGGPSGYADRQEAAVRAPVEAPVRAVGGELVPDADFATGTLPAILDTLVNPDAVAADASRDRLDLAKNAGSLELALDTADTIQAGDALERMLAHQLATTHVLAMKAAAVMGQQLDIADRTMGAAKQAACVEANRMAPGRKRLGENGLPQDPPTPEQQEAANRTKMTVTTKPEPNPHEIKGAVVEECSDRHSPSSLVGPERVAPL